ncbi:hypothetical protein BDK51DRAFT_45659 [Blyttiomyces helicus]|uniref:Uncharacterized protein n=1 Tax=Blyttiomyces helicus TaxID=388810 RepID=A0A4V1IRX2_9FUNG|nr:hypothetical protein BDK51DRAFT_45659 [Blyttiomyces helicus]|eukprot:RKO91547.1 hypothetical protein BDK51DRAFT_45659 [Blyttiomyces helicus]
MSDTSDAEDFPDVLTLPAAATAALWHDPLQIALRVSIGLYRLRHGASYIVIGNQLTVAWNTALAANTKFVNTVNKVCVQHDSQAASLREFCEITFALVALHNILNSRGNGLYL